MDLKFKERFMELWRKYFNGAELPMTFYYTNEEGRGELVKAPAAAHQCVIGVLGKVRKGRSLCFEADSVGCGGPSSTFLTDGASSRCPPSSSSQEREIGRRPSPSFHPINIHVVV
ncbi:MAG: hypothetical protein MUO52_00095 [Desulfobacterales bacterium]|nr:hypothetical protein [Desulfobacterales bacterium]